MEPVGPLQHLPEYIQGHCHLSKLKHQPLGTPAEVLRGRPRRFRADQKNTSSPCLLIHQISVGQLCSRTDSPSYRRDGLPYVWVRRFDSEPERERLYPSAYESDNWEKAIGPRVPEMIDQDRSVIRRIEATPRSVIR